jgi:hypothetical protein
MNQVAIDTPCGLLPSGQLLGYSGYDNMLEQLSTSLGTTFVERNLTNHERAFSWDG